MGVMHRAEAREEEKRIREKFTATLVIAAANHCGCTAHAGGEHLEPQPKAQLRLGRERGAGVADFGEGVAVGCLRCQREGRPKVLYDNVGRPDGDDETWCASGYPFRGPA